MKATSVWAEILKKTVMRPTWRYCASCSVWFHKENSAASTYLWGKWRQHPSELKYWTSLIRMICDFSGSTLPRHPRLPFGKHWASTYVISGSIFFNPIPLLWSNLWTVPNQKWKNHPCWSCYSDCRSWNSSSKYQTSKISLQRNIATVSFLFVKIR